jgi:predicted acyltransferase (DUF342 family)
MDGRTKERGAVMVWALIFVIVTAGMIISHSAYMASHRQTMDVHLKRKPLAANFARAALTDALSWFQAQATQPVVDFAPVRDLGVNPPIIDTQDPTVGLVREFEIRGNLWGRYELRKNEAMDASLQYGVPSPGSVWELAARGYVYRVTDPTVPFDQPPNKIVSTSRVETKVRSLPLNLPASAALGIDNILNLTLGPGGRVAGGGTTAGVAGPLVDPIPAMPVTVTGTPGVVTLSVYKSSAQDVFRMSLAELRDISDLSVATGFPRWLSAPLPDSAIVYHDGDLTITSTQRLAGSMLLVVAGNLNIQAGSNSNVQGVVYVTGNADLRGPFTLKGMLVAKGTVHLQGNGAGQDALVQHDAATVQRLMQSLSRYRASRIIRSLDKEEGVAEVTTAPTVGTGTTVAPSAEIEGVVTLGDGVVVEDDVEIDGGTIVGDNVTIQRGARLEENVQVGNSVTIGSRAFIDEFAVIGDGATIGAGATVGRGAHIAPGAIIPPNTVVRAGATVL